MEKEILIFGHKNPDTDSICSSLVKERLSKKLKMENVKAVRLGKINKETKYVLDYLKTTRTRVSRKIRRRATSNNGRSQRI